MRSLAAGDTGFLDHVLPMFVDSAAGQTYADLLDHTYAYARKNYRFEYYYKNVLLEKLLLQKRKSHLTALTELPIGEAKADFVLIGRTGTVYEIKTGYDNLDRLSSQIMNYYMAFSKVVVVTCRKHLDAVLSSTPEFVGIIELTPRGALRTIRPAVKRTEDLKDDAMIRILRREEYEDILRKEGLKPRTRSDFRYYRECTGLLKTLDPELLQKRVMQELEQRIDGRAAGRCAEFPESLHLLTYLDSFDISRDAVLLQRALMREYGERK